MKPPEQKIPDLQAIYRDYDAAVRDYKQEAVCRPGCAFCCTHFGSVDMTTLEGLALHNHLASLGAGERVRFQKRLDRNRRAKEKGTSATCPFLSDDQHCVIYEVRPFSCRQLYSLRACNGNGPTVHRQAVELARNAVIRLQQLDDTGYSGHMSFILELLKRKPFRRLYLSGGYDPQRIAAFGKRYGIVINIKS